MIKVFFVLLVFAFLSCTQNSEKAMESLFKVDREFSSTSEKLGYNKAFIKYAHNEAVLLRDNNWPLSGKLEITKNYEAVDPKNINFTWQPIDGNIAKSGELGYTYGTYELKKDTVIEKGTYVSIWKKDKNGDWKYILDSGNQGLGAR